MLHESVVLFSDIIVVVSETPISALVLLKIK